MADYRELLRKAIDALPDNTGANRRAVYEKARSALVSQLRAIDPPLPAREITQHRLNLEDCIREVEQEATDKLLGRHRDDDAAQPEETGEPEDAQDALSAAVAAKAADDTQSEPAAEPEPSEAAPVDAPSDDPGTGAEVEAAEPDDADADEITKDDADAMAEAPAAEPEPEPVSEPAPEPQSEAPAAEDEMPVTPEDTGEEPVVADGAGDDVSPDETGEDVEQPSQEEDDTAAPDVVPGSVPEAAEPAPAQEPDPEPAPEDTDVSVAPDDHNAASIEDIIAQASAESEAASRRAADDQSVTGDSPRGEASGIISGPGEAPHRESHFIATPYEGEKGKSAGLVDVHGKPIGHSAPAAPLAAAGIGEAMSSVREVEIESNVAQNNDPQSAIDRAIAALDREARGEAEPDPDAAPSAPEKDAPAASAPLSAEATGKDNAPVGEGEEKSGFGALTVFLAIAIVLLVGGGAGGYWAWREGYIDLDTIFAQSGGDVPSEVAQVEDSLEPADTGPAEVPAPEAEAEPAPEAADGPVNTTDAPEQPDTGVAQNGAAEDAPIAETETPGNGAEDTPELAFEDRLPAEADTPGAETPATEAGEALALAGDGPQSLLLEEQANGNSGAVPYSGSVSWTRGTDEMGQPTIEATATIPARNLDVEILLRRNADDTLPASHLLEVNFDVAETFVGGSIANLPGVLLKDEELVQGEPLTGASARIVGNSFLFALSSASDQDVENNIALLNDRAWLDLAMVYGTGRRAILTLEKGEDGSEIFDDVMASWAESDADTGAEGDAETAADAAAEAESTEN